MMYVSRNSAVVTSFYEEFEVETNVIIKEFLENFIA